MSLFLIIVETVVLVDCYSNSVCSSDNEPIMSSQEDCCGSPSPLGSAFVIQGMDEGSAFVIPGMDECQLCGEFL